MTTKRRVAPERISASIATLHSDRNKLCAKRQAIADKCAEDIDGIKYKAEAASAKVTKRIDAIDKTLAEVRKQLAELDSETPQPDPKEDPADLDGKGLARNREGGDG